MNKFLGKYAKIEILFQKWFQPFAQYITAKMVGYEGNGDIKWVRLIPPTPLWKLYFVSKIVLTYSKKKMFKGSIKTFEINRTIYLSRERSEQFLKQISFINLLLEASQI